MLEFRMQGAYGSKAASAARERTTPRQLIAEGSTIPAMTDPSAELKETVRHPRHALMTVLFILFLTFLDNTMVAVVLSDIQGSLHTGILGLQWVVNGYMLTFAAFMLTGGTLGDLFGRKKLMLSGIALFVAGSLVAVFSTGNTLLVVGRILMGLGAAASEPGTLSMIRHIFPERKKRVRAVGAWSAVCAVALAMGPILGGVIAALWSWRAVFGANTILGAAAFIAGWALLPENSDPEGRHLDLQGIALWILALATGAFGTIQGEVWGYFNFKTDVLLAACLVFTFLFIRVERKKPDPVLRLDFFRIPIFTSSNLIVFATNFGLFALFFFTALYLEILGGFSGYGIAESFLAMAGTMVFSAWFTGKWIARHGQRVPCILGCLVSAAGILLVRAVLGPHISMLALAWADAVVGIGFGMTLVATNSAVLGLVPPERSGMAASTVNTFRELGGVFGVSILGAIVNSELTGKLAARLRGMGLPPNFTSMVIDAITHGGGRVGSGGKTPAPPGYASVVKKAIQAAKEAFGSGLQVALLIAACLLLGAGILAWFTIRTSQPSQTSTDRAAKAA